MQSSLVAPPVPLSESHQMPERSAVAARYRSARLPKLPRNGADKKGLDVRIGSANLPVSNPPKVKNLIGKEGTASKAGDESDDFALHIVAKRQRCCRKRAARRP